MEILKTLAAKLNDQVLTFLLIGAILGVIAFVYLLTSGATEPESLVVLLLIVLIFLFLVLIAGIIYTLVDRHKSPPPPPPDPGGIDMQDRDLLFNILESMPEATLDRYKTNLIQLEQERRRVTTPAQLFDYLERTGLLEELKIRVKSDDWTKVPNVGRYVGQLS